MSGGNVSDRVTITLRDYRTGDLHDIYLDVWSNSLSDKWLAALNQLLSQQAHLEKNYCWMGFADGDRDGKFIIDQINSSIDSINRADIGYQIDDYFVLSDVLPEDPPPGYRFGRLLDHDRFNRLHRYFEDLQGTSGNISKYYINASPEIRWHIRQLNLLCHEFETWALSYRKQIQAPEWQRPSTLMCWLKAPRFVLDEQDYQYFGIHALNRPTGGVFLGVNKAVGKHHWEVFQDEGRDSRIGELVTSTLKSQTEAAGDFDIEWGRYPGTFDWHQNKLKEFREWLIANGFDPSDPSLTIGHPRIGQIDLMESFDTDCPEDIWKRLNRFLDVYKIQTSDAVCVYDYHWSDSDYRKQQIEILQRTES